MKFPPISREHHHTHKALKKSITAKGESKKVLSALAKQQAQEEEEEAAKKCVCVLDETTNQ